MTTQEFDTAVVAFVQAYRGKEDIPAIRDDDEGWVTINGTHVLIDDEGVAQSGGNLKGKNFSKAKSQKKAKSKAPSAHKIAEGKDLDDIAQGYQGETDIRSIIHAQGFDGPPRVVSGEEFDEAVKKSGVSMQRVYTASSKEILDAYRDALYEGEWYVECSEGGSAYGKGMYTVSDYTGEGADEVKKEIAFYSDKFGEDKLNYVEDMTLDPGAKIADGDELDSVWSGVAKKNTAFFAERERLCGEVLDEHLKTAEKRFGRDAAEYVRTAVKNSNVSGEEHKKAEEMFGDSIREVDALALKAIEDVNRKRFKYNEKLRERSEYLQMKYGFDAGAYAAALGYDAVRYRTYTTKKATYTVVLNRTKLIIRDGRQNTDEEDAGMGGITFRPAGGGRIKAVRDGKVIGWVMENYARPDEEKGVEPRTDDDDDDNWVWITLENGAHIPLDESGTAVGGAGGWAKGKDFSGAKTGADSPKREHRTVSGQDILDTYEGKGGISDVMHAQGFDGLPKLVSQEEFDEAVKKSGVAMQRVYTASSRDILDAYRDALYNGEWYVECLSGGSLYGKGMYTVSDYTGKSGDAVKKAISKYAEAQGNDKPHYVEDITLDPGAKIADYRDLKAMWFGEMTESDYQQAHDGYIKERIREVGSKYGEKAGTYMRGLCNIPPKVSYEEHKSIEKELGTEVTQTLKMYRDMFEEEAEEEVERYSEELEDKAAEYMHRFTDINAMAVAMGYDAVKCFPEGTEDGATYTVILNRTKAIIRDGRRNTDEADTAAGDITFRPGENGRAIAVKNGHPAGWVLTQDYHFAAEDRRADAEPPEWITLKNGQHVPLDEEGRAMGGAGGWAKGKDFSGAKKQKTAEKPERKAVSGKDITASYKGKGDIRSVIHEQGFDGLPKVVSQKEFDEAVKKSGVIMQRAYGASSQDVLDAYRDSLYNGEWYVECEGGYDYGRGMYTVSDYTGDAGQSMRWLIGDYRGKGPSYVEKMTLAPDAKTADFKEIEKLWEGEVPLAEWMEIQTGYILQKAEEIEKEQGQYAALYVRWCCGEEDLSEAKGAVLRKVLGEKKCAELDRAVSDINLGSEFECMRIRKEREEKAYDIRNRYSDIGAYAAALGYDAIKVTPFWSKGFKEQNGHEPATYTVVLNRTRTIILDGRQNRDGADMEKGTITFRPGKNGKIDAVRDGKVIGWVMTNDYQPQNADEDEGDEEKQPEVTDRAEDLIEHIRRRLNARAKKREGASFDGSEPASWITLENGEHVPLDTQGKAIGGAGGWAQGKDFSKAGIEPPRYGKKAEAPKAEGAFKVRNGYKAGDTFELWQMANMVGRDNPIRKALKKIYDKEGIEGIKKEYYSHRTLEASKNIHPISKDEAGEILYDNMPQNVFHGWFMEADSGYKPRVVNAVTGNPEARNAALNTMYLNYRYETGEDISFEDFLTTPVTMYRGGHGQKHTGDDIFSSYSFKKSIAEKFAGENGTVYEAKIRPTDTWGSVLTNGESEILVPFWIAPNANKDSNEDARLDRAYDEWLEENLDLFGTEEDETDFHKWKNRDGRRPDDCEVPGEVGKMWEEYNSRREDGVSSDGFLDAPEKLRTRNELLAMFWINGNEYLSQKLIDRESQGVILLAEKGGGSRKDKEPASWITLENGAHIPLDENGTAIGGAGGAAKGQDFSKHRNQPGADKRHGQTKNPKPSAKGRNVPCTGMRDKETEKEHEKHWAEFGVTTQEEYDRLAIEFLQRPVGGDIDGYIRKPPEGSGLEPSVIVRFDRKTGTFGVGIPGHHFLSFFVAKYDRETGKADLERAIRYFERLKEREEYEGGE